MEEGTSVVLIRICFSFNLLTFNYFTFLCSLVGFHLIVFCKSHHVSQNFSFVFTKRSLFPAIVSTPSEISSLNFTFKKRVFHWKKFVDCAMQTSFDIVALFH